MLEMISNSTRLYSPVMLNQEWPRVGRLLFTVICSTVGTILNGFFVASFFVEITLRRIGLVYMACVGLADFIITATVMPISSVVLLSGEWDVEPVCKAVEVLSVGATYAYSVFFMMTALEMYYKYCRGSDYQAFISRLIGLQSFVIFVISYATAYAGVIYELDYDYCRRSHSGNFYFRTTTLVIFHGIPFIVTMYSLLRTGCRIRDKASKFANYKRSASYECDSLTNNLNVTAYLLFVVAWIPYLLVVYKYPDASDAQYYQSAWVGVCRSVFTSFLYGFMDIGFRHAFAHLFNYCCCKSTLSGPFASRHRRDLEQGDKIGETKVHPLQAVNANSPQRGASTSRETQEL